MAPPLPWTAGKAAGHPGDMVVLASALQLRSRRQTIQFLRAVGRIRRQLRDAEGLVGFTLLAKPLRGHYRTLSAWAGRDDLDRFVRTGPHLQVMKDWNARLRSTSFVDWTGEGGMLPTWDDAHRRLA
jgi:hypothetical protein